MTERDDILLRFGEAGILNGIRWAYRSAARQVSEDFSEECGHTAGWVGNTRYVLFRDRLDRVFSCGRYVLSEDVHSGEGRDIVFASLTQDEIETLPLIDPNLVQRSNLNHSIGWSFSGIRWLLASGPYGKLDTIRWDRRSRTKTIVAQQRNVDPNQASLFEVLPEESTPEWIDAVATPHLADLDQLTLVISHSQDIMTWRSEMGIGIPCLARDGSAWNWYEDLLTTPPTKGGVRLAQPSNPADDANLNEPDAPVKLRRKVDGAELRTAEEN
ncbi:hypothetical protein [Arthrobacter yangruifuii]|uniref:hypothetical protein n=1 Tax=Arthrobacter yangruifuii TaxID=2606616 RepID=UPI0011B83F0B|nr:hypothetical protein [Arthrobacter yangruifuii]